jgi:hypothetical protein
MIRIVPLPPERLIIKPLPGETWFELFDHAGYAVSSEGRALRLNSGHGVTAGLMQPRPRRRIKGGPLHADCFYIRNWWISPASIRKTIATFQDRVKRSKIKIVKNHLPPRRPALEQALSLCGPILANPVETYRKLITANLPPTVTPAEVWDTLCREPYLAGFLLGCPPADWKDPGQYRRPWEWSGNPVTWSKEKAFDVTPPTFYNRETVKPISPEPQAKVGRPSSIDQAKAAEILRLKQAGQSNREIAEAVGLGRATVNRFLLT